ncbi:hypothetical protein [Candidatus Mycalebacterium sp.]
MKSPLFAAILSAVLAAGFSWLINLHGVFFSPDSWQYWESSVSILDGVGYQNYFHPIKAWPPLYSLYLSAVQAVFGVNGFSLVLSLIVCAVGSAFAWTWAFCSLCGEKNTWARFALAFSNAALASYLFRSISSDPLSVFLIGLLIAFAVRFVLKPRSSRFIAGFLFFALLSACLLTRFANITFIPALWAGAFYFFRPRKLKTAFAVCALTLPAFAIIMAVRVALNLSEGVHSFSFGGHNLRTFELLNDFFIFLGELLFTTGGAGEFFKAPLAFFAVCLCVYALFFKFACGRGFERISILKAIAIIFAVQTAGMLGILHLATYDVKGGLPLIVEERYIWHIPFAIMGTFAALLTHFPQMPEKRGRRILRFSKKLLPIAFVFLCGLHLFAAAGYGISNALTHTVSAGYSEKVLFFRDKHELIDNGYIWHIPKNHTIRYRFAGRPPVHLENGTVLRSPGGPMWWQFGESDKGELLYPPAFTWGVRWERLLELPGREISVPKE